MFNTGTNLLGDILKYNFRIQGRGDLPGHGIRHQVPCGKHNPPGMHRLNHVAKVGKKGVNQTNVLPLVMIKDFYHCIIS